METANQQKNLRAGAVRWSICREPAVRAMGRHSVFRRFVDLLERVGLFPSFRRLFLLPSGGPPAMPVRCGRESSLSPAPRPFGSLCRRNRAGHNVRVVAATLVRSLGVGLRGLKNDVHNARVLSEPSRRMDVAIHAHPIRALLRTCMIGDLAIYGAEAGI
jgi:hypothetical protein